MKVSKKNYPLNCSSGHEEACFNIQTEIFLLNAQKMYGKFENYQNNFLAINVRLDNAVSATSVFFQKKLKKLGAIFKKFVILIVQNLKTVF